MWLSPSRRGGGGAKTESPAAMWRLGLHAQLVISIVLLVEVKAAVYEPSEAEKVIGGKIHHAESVAEKLAYYDEFVELKNARIAEAVEAQKIYRVIADQATARADMLADRLAVEAAAVGVERNDASRKQALVIAAEKNVALLRSQLEDARMRLKSFEEAKSKPGQLADMISSNVGYLGAAAGDERGGRQFGFALAGALGKAHRELRLLEGAVEAHTGVSTLRGRVLAAFVCSFVVCLPLWFTSCLIGRMTRSIGYRQHIIVGYIFNATIAAGNLLSYLLFGRDPLVMIVRNSAARFVLCLFFVGQWAVMILLIVHGLFLGYRRPKVWAETVLHLASYTMMILHIRLLTYPNLLMVAENVEGAYVIWRYYVGYVIVFTALTYMAAAKSVGKSDGALVRDLNDAINSGVSGVVGEAERLLGSSSGDQSFVENLQTSRSGLAGHGSRSSIASSEGIPVMLDEISAAEAKAS